MSIQTESSYVFYGGSVSLIVYKVRRVNDSSRIDRVKLTSALIVNAFAILHCFTTHVQVPISKGYPEKTSNTSIFFSILFVVVCALNKKIKIPRIYGTISVLVCTLVTLSVRKSYYCFNYPFVLSFRVGIHQYLLKALISLGKEKRFLREGKRFLL